MKRKKVQEIFNILDKADPERVEAYMHMFDRILLYTIAANLMPEEARDETIELWDKVIKKTIDIDSLKRTKFLEGTSIGRLAKFRDEPDGEDLRLHCLRQWEIARDVISTNLRRNDNIEDDFDFPTPTDSN